MTEIFLNFKKMNTIYTEITNEFLSGNQEQIQSKLL